MVISTTPVNTTKIKWGSLPQAYIICLQASAILPNAQKHMCATHQCSPISKVNTSHSPFVSKPSELANHLDLINLAWQ